MKKEIPVRDMSNEEFIENITDEIIEKHSNKKLFVWLWLIAWCVFLIMAFSLFITNNKLNQAQAIDTIEEIRLVNISKAEKLQKQVISARDELQKKVDNLNIKIRDIEKCKTENSEKWKAVDCLIFNNQIWK